MDVQNSQVLKCSNCEYETKRLWKTPCNHQFCSYCLFKIGDKCSVCSEFLTHNLLESIRRNPNRSDQPVFISHLETLPIDQLSVSLYEIDKRNLKCPGLTRFIFNLPPQVASAILKSNENFKNIFKLFKIDDIFETIISTKYNSILEFSEYITEKYVFIWDKMENRILPGDDDIMCYILMHSKNKYTTEEYKTFIQNAADKGYVKDWCVIHMSKTSLIPEIIIQKFIL